MGTYSIAQVEALTGIKGHTIRIWERRYSFLNPERTATNIRYYSDDEVRLLINVAILNRNGYKVSKIDQLTKAEINDLVLQMQTSADLDNKSIIDQLTKVMLNMDEVEFERQAKELIDQRGVYRAITGVIYPFLNHVGVLWSTQNAMPSQEHFVSNLVRQKIISAIDALPIAPKEAPGVLLFLTEDEHHEIGLLLAAYIVRRFGWQTIYLGQRVPTDNVLEVVAQKSPLVAFTILISPLNSKYERHLNEILSGISVPLLASGNPDNFAKFSKMFKNMHFLRTPEELQAYLNEHSA